MRLFRKRNHEAASQAHLHEIEASVQQARDRLSNAKMPIEELFRLMGEDDREALASMQRAKEVGRNPPEDFQGQSQT